MQPDTPQTPDADALMQATKDKILNAALIHVPFDGWSDATLSAAVGDSGVAPALAQALFPRGGVDLAVAFHRRGDCAMVYALGQTDLAQIRFRDRIALAVKLRLNAVDDRELVRRGSTLFAMPNHAAEGAGLIWSTADAIWTALGDTDRDFNWYSKRASLSAVYGATVLFWLGDDSEGHSATWEFLDRRIENVMQFEKVKAAVRKNPIARAILAGPAKLLAGIRAPAVADDLPGRVKNG